MQISSPAGWDWYLLIPSLGMQVLPEASRLSAGSSPAQLRSELAVSCSTAIQPLPMQA